VLTTADDVIAALSNLGVVEWGRFSVGSDSVDGLCQPSMIVWRFAESRADSAELISKVVDDVEGPVRWAFDSSARNWTLMPEPLRDAFQEHSNDNYPSVLSDFKRGNQPFCLEADEALGRILGRIRAL